VVQSGLFVGVFALICFELLALLALVVAYLYRKPRSPFWYVVYFDGDQKEKPRSTGLRADDPNDTVKAKGMQEIPMRAVVVMVHSESEGRAG